MQSFEVIKGRNPDVLVICDHASNHVPAEMERLGLPPSELERHIAWDIGAAAVARKLARRFKCAALLATHSRLVVDLNRSPRKFDLIPVQSDGTLIPGNKGLSGEERSLRQRLFFEPYHAQLRQMLDARTQAFVISVHSFTPHPREGERRQLDVGLLAKRDRDGGDWGSAEGFLDALNPLLIGRINEPYSAYDLNYTMDTHVVPRRLRHLGIEIRQDHIEGEPGQKRMARWIGEAIEEIL